MASDPIKWSNKRVQITNVTPFKENILNRSQSWTILNFNSSLNYVSSAPSTPYWYSFTTEGPCHTRSWGLYFFLDGVDDPCKNYVSVYLYLESKELEDVTSSTVTLKLYDDSNAIKLIEGFKMDVGDISGLKKWKPRTSATVNVKVSIIITEKIHFNNYLDRSELIFSKPGDVILIGTDWEYIAHVHMLSENSPVFKAMFKHDMEESKTGKIHIKDIEAPVMRSLLLYIYTGSPIGLPELVTKLVVAADKYCMEDLKKRCEDYMLQNMCTSNVAELLVLADQCKLKELKEKCLSILRVLPDNIKKTQKWKLVEQKQNLLAECINHLLRANFI